jgi:hypothetical protein
MVTADYSRYGVLEGAMISDPFGISCGIVCSGWPSWAIAAKNPDLGFIKIIIIKNNLWKSEIKSVFPDVCILEYTDFECWMSLSLDVQFWLTDIDPPRKLSIFGTNADAIVACQRVRDFQGGRLDVAGDKAGSC